MADFLERLHKKPIHERKRILLITTFSITAVIFIIWFIAFYISLGGTISHVSGIKSSYDDFTTNLQSIEAKFNF